MADAAEEIERYEAENAGWVRTAKDLFAGAAGGVAQVLLGEFPILFYLFAMACVLRQGELPMPVPFPGKIHVARFIQELQLPEARLCLENVTSSSNS